MTRFSAFLVAIVAVVAPVTAGAETIHLHGGAEVTGEILLRKADTLVVDLGFRVIEIPTIEVESIVPDDAAEPVAAESADLFSGEPGRVELSVKENIDRCGEAVVQVRTPTGLGSGFVIHPTGYVVTNQHVISGEHQISITLFRQGEHELEQVHFKQVRIVALDSWTDLALLKIEDGGDQISPPSRWVSTTSFARDSRSSRSVLPSGSTEVFQRESSA